MILTPHVVPPFYKEWLEKKGISAGDLPIPEWSEKTCLEQNQRNGVETSILSVSTPGVYLENNNNETKDMARKVNEFCFNVVKKNPKNFGYFATLLLPDVENSMAEAKYASNHLKADGVILVTNVGNTYLGEPEQEPLMEMLNEKKAVVFIHPSHLPAKAVD